VKDYSWLRGRIAGWLMRDDLHSAIPDFVVLAEASINRRLRVRRMITRAYAVVTGRSLPLPIDWLGSIKAWVGADNELPTTGLPPDSFPARIVDTGRPTSYTVLGNSFYFSQLDETPTRIELAYFAEVPSLFPEYYDDDFFDDDEEQTNWLLQKWPDLYLYGSLMHSAPYLKDDPRLAVWEAMFEKALAEAKLSDSLSYDGTIHQVIPE
jgi:hypothetical protein